MPFLSGTMRVAGWDATGRDSCSRTLGIHFSDGFDRSKREPPPSGLLRPFKSVLRSAGNSRPGGPTGDTGRILAYWKTLYSNCKKRMWCFRRDVWQRKVWKLAFPEDSQWVRSWMIYNTFDSFSSSHVTPSQNSLTGFSCTDESTVLRQKK